MTACFGMSEISSVLLHCRCFPYIWALWDVKWIFNRGNTFCYLCWTWTKYSCHVITLCFQIKEIHLFHSRIIFPCDIFLYILLHNLSGSTQCDRGKPIFFSGGGVWTEYRSKELKIYWYPQFTTHSVFRVGSLSNYPWLPNWPCLRQASLSHL